MMPEATDGARDAQAKRDDQAARTKAANAARKGASAKVQVQVEVHALTRMLTIIGDLMLREDDISAEDHAMLEEYKRKAGPYLRLSGGA